MSRITSVLAIMTAVGIAANPLSADEPDKVKTISEGKKVTLKDHLVKGKFTIFEFYADW